MSTFDIATLDTDKAALEAWNSRPRGPYQQIAVRPLSAALGAEITGVDLVSPSDAQIAEIRQALRDHLVIVFRDQELTRDSHKALARHFGTLHQHPLAKARAGEADFDAEILAWKTGRTTKYTAGEGWHADVTADEFPIWGSLLRVTRLPESGGGDTLFSNQYLAYDLLSPPIKWLLQGLTAIHDGARPWTQLYGELPSPGQHFARTEHPIVTRHPHTGRPLLFVNSGFTTRIPQLQPAESDALLQILFVHINNAAHIQTRIAWTPGSLVFWDNWASQHRAVWDYYPFERWGERVSTVIGQRPTAWHDEGDAVQAHETVSETA